MGKGGGAERRGLGCGDPRICRFLRGSSSTADPGQPIRYGLGLSGVRSWVAVLRVVVCLSSLCVGSGPGMADMALHGPGVRFARMCPVRG